MKKYYYLYQITNKLNGKIYIGVHQTYNLEDGYMGSGTLLKRAQNKYGKENFEKEVLKMFDCEDDMFNNEAEYINSEFILREDTYNIVEGGNGRWSLEAQIKGGKQTGHKNAMKHYNNKTGMFSEEGIKERDKYLISKENLLQLLSMSNKVKNSEEIQKKRKNTFKQIKHAQGDKNSQYGTMWITNGIDSKKISKEEQIPSGWKKGRVQKKK